jgi:peptidoglycan/LPS O-acetylase OafA/YrhL
LYGALASRNIPSLEGLCAVSVILVVFVRLHAPYLLCSRRIPYRLAAAEGVRARGRSLLSITPVGVVIGTGFASVSYFVVEKPFLRLKSKFSRVEAS